MAKICSLSRAGCVASLTVPQPSTRQRSKQMEFEERTRKALSEASGPRPVDVGTNESALTIHKRKLDKRRHSGLDNVGT